MFDRSTPMGLFFSRIYCTQFALILLGSFAALVACSGSDPTPAGGSATPPPAANSMPSRSAEARSVWDEPSFELRADAAGPYQAGHQGTFAIQLQARGAYHVNQDYPMSIQITSPQGVSLPRATLGRPEASEFTETRVRFDVPFVASSGRHELRALVDFAVCTPESCMPDSRTLAITLNVP